MQQALGVHLHTLGERHPAVMSTLNSLGQLEMRRDNFAAAIDHARRAVAIAEAGASPPRDGAYVRVSYANVLDHAGRHDEALTQVGRAIEVLKGIDANELRLPLAHEIEASALLGLGRSDEARQVAETALHDRERLLPTDEEGRALCHSLLARIAEARHDAATARREHERGRRIVANLATPSPYLLKEMARR